MSPIVITETDETPAVNFDPATNVFEISGKSLPEDVTSFYDPILSWLDEYSGSPNATSAFTFKMEYFNTASSKMILDILLKLEEINEDDAATITINWYFREDDEDMEEAGEEYADIVELDFDQISYN
jgi:hypothetical protein